MTEHLEQHQNWWRQIKPHPVATLLIVLLAAVIVLVTYGGYSFQWDWTGFTRPSKTLWDWLQLLGVLAVPIVVGFGAVWFTSRQTRISEANRQQQHDTDVQIAETQQQEELLRNYIDKLSELLLVKDSYSDPTIGSIVRARTLAALHIFNQERKAIVLRFLHDADLLKYVKHYLYSLDLSQTDLSRIDLSDASLFEADLSDASLWGVDLSVADLKYAKITEEQLSEAKSLKGAIMPDGKMYHNSSGANLRGASLNAADVRGVDLSGADLREADLHGVDLSNTDLSGANLSGATGSTTEQLAKANLKGATMPDGSIHP